MIGDDTMKDLLDRLNKASTGRKVASDILEGNHDAPEDIGKPTKTGKPGKPKKAAFEARVTNAQKALNVTDPGDVTTTVETLARQKRQEGRVEGMAWGIMRELLERLEQQDTADLANGTLPPTHAWHSLTETRQSETEKPKPGKWQKGLEGLAALKQQLDERQETDATPPAAKTPPEPAPGKMFLPVLWKPKALVRWQRPLRPKPPLPEVIHLGPPQMELAVAPWPERVRQAPSFKPTPEMAERLAQWRARGILDNTTGGYCRSQDRHSDCIMRASENPEPVMSRDEVKRLQKKALAEAIGD